jgi:Tfp pilus assembly pilus retraction ATPase PilT
VDGKGRKAAIEILINTPIIADKLLKGEFHEIKAIMVRNDTRGGKTLGTEYPGAARVFGRGAKPLGSIFLSGLPPTYA